jgi:hypothetical protein
MSEFSPYDAGLGVPPGYVNPSVPEFAINTNGEAGFASQIGQAGGEVIVNGDGGISLTVPGLATIAIDASNNITLASADGGINILSDGAGNDVNILNAGTITFDPFGAGAIINVQHINGQVYPPPGGSGTSITQAGALVACLGSGAVAISSIGGGVNVEVYNAGTIRFDASGAGAITGLSTINNAAYPPNFVIPSDITVSTLTANSISTLGLEGVSTVNGNAFVPFTGSLSSISNGLGYVACSAFGDIQLFANGSANMYMMASNHPTIPNDVVISCGGTGSGLSLQNPNFVNLNNGTAGSFLTMDASGAVSLEGTSVSLNNVSTINGSEYPFYVSTLGNIGTGGFVFATTSNVAMGVSAAAIDIDSGNAITVGSATANTSIVFASTIQASGDGLNIFELSAGANVRLDTSGKVYFNEGLSTITDGTGLVVATEGYSLTFPLDTTGSFNVGEIVNLSTINGAEYPIAPRQATYYKSADQTLTSGNTDITFDQTAAYNNTGGYITHTDGTTDFEVGQAGVYQLEFNSTVSANGGTWTTATNKVIAIDITRSPTAEQAVIASSSVMASATNYAQSVSGTFYLEAGDVINLRLTGTFASGPPTALGLANTIDLGTFFTWRFIA